MPLPRSVFITNQSIPNLLAELARAPSKEVDVASSASFVDEPSYLGEIQIEWERFYESIVELSIKELGPPTSRYDWKEYSKRPWLTILRPELSVHILTIWDQCERCAYLRFGWEDRELPFVIAFGMKNSIATGYSYPGQFGLSK